MNAITRKINTWRGEIMMSLTKNVGLSYQNSRGYLKSPEDLSRILISRPNHRLGNLLLITPLLQEVSETFPNAKIDLFVKGNLPPLIFQNYANVSRIIQLPRKPFKKLIAYVSGWIALKNRHYDLAMNVVYDSSSGRLSVQFTNASLKFFGDKGSGVQQDQLHMGKYPVYVFRESMKQLGFDVARKEVPLLDLRLSRNEIKEGQAQLLDMVKNERKTICLFTYATDLKCYTSVWWEELYTGLRKNYPEFNIIEVLPVENVSQLSFKAPAYYSKNVREIGSLIANTTVFIGADSGMMHLASAVHTPTVGLFKITNVKAYEPYNNDSLGINTTDLTMDDILQRIDRVIASALQAEGDNSIQKRPVWEVSL